ncbi:MAG TPA: hypothetical protein VGA50_06095 [Kiloniellales bacterium]
MGFQDGLDHKIGGPTEKTVGDAVEALDFSLNVCVHGRDLPFDVLDRGEEFAPTLGGPFKLSCPDERFRVPLGLPFEAGGLGPGGRQPAPGA